jgi:hypothetical protein
MCIAPVLVAEELLRAEGFTDVRYVPAGGGFSFAEFVARGEVDFASSFAGSVVYHLDRGLPLTVLAGFTPVASSFSLTNPFVQSAIARSLVDRGFIPRYDYAFQSVTDIPYAAWRDFDAEDSMRFYALGLYEARMISSSPTKILSEGADWRVLNELRRELKA